MADYSDLAYALSGYGKKANRFDSLRKYGFQQLQAGSDTSPVQSPWQGAARLAQSLAGVYGLYQADKGETEADKKRSDALAQAMAEPDPQKRIGLLAAYDPDAGARAAGQLAVEQAKMNQQRELLTAGANSFGGTLGQPQAAQSPSMAPLPQGTVAPGGFANNAGNIRASNLPWEGKGPPQNGFETFATPQAGANAMAGNLAAYARQNPTMTVAQAIAKWAPPTENNTQGYISRLSEATGINPGMPLGEVLRDPAVAATLMDGIARIEKGGLPQGFTADTFMQAAGPPMQGPQQVTQGGGDAPGAPPAPNPAQVSGPAIVAPPQAPAVPETARPQPSPQQIAQYRQRLMSGEFGMGADAVSKARAALDADLDRQWGVDRERARMQFEQQGSDYRAQRDQQMKQPQEAFQNEKALRGEFETQPAVKSYRTVVPMLESAKEAGMTRAGDLNLVYAFAKLMDPDSVVRESETGAVVATQSVADRLQAYIGQLNGQPMLNAETRQKLIAELDSRFRALQSSHDALAQQYGDIAKAHGIAPERVLVSVRNGSGGRPEGNQPSQGELQRWSQGGQTGQARPVYGMDGRPIR